jgi:DNA repair exonuclease SbcCD ATPase subunit
VKEVWILAGLLAFCLFPSQALPVETAPRITDREIVEKLTRLEEGQKALGQRIDDTNRRLEEGLKALNQRIDDTNRRLEEGLKALNQRVEEGAKALNLRIDDTNRRIDELKQDLGQRIDELRQTLLWGLGVMFAGMFALVGLVIWDSRSALAPAVRQMEGLREREEKLEAALREYASRTPELAESLKKMGLL